MKLRYLLALCLVSGVADAQMKWEKRLAPGVMLRQEVDLKTPLVMTAIRFSPGCPAIRLEAWKSKDQVFDDTPEKGREAVGTAVKRKGAIAGLNGDFFQVPYNGDPLGLMMMNGEIVSNPVIARSAFGWGNGAWQIAVPSWTNALKIGDSDPLTLDGINEAANMDRLVLETPTVGGYPAKTPNVTVVAKLIKGGFKSGEVVELEAISVAKDVASSKVEAGKVSLVATGAKAAMLAEVKAGVKLSVTLNLSGFDYTKVQNVIGGGPRLVRDGKAAVAADEEKFRENFVKKRHPRSAIGISAEGELWLVAVDGRQKFSDGATLDELANLMVHLGCVDAMNLDGGGSTDLALSGYAVNRPSDGVERPVANGFLLFENPGGTPEPKFSHKLAMRFPAGLEPDGRFNLSLVENGAKVPNAEVIWTAAGDGWVDQGGTLHAFQAGSIKVTAYSRGTKLQATITVGAGASAKKSTTAPAKPKG